jgi:hypothetical protein
MTKMNKKPTRCTKALKSLKPYCILIPLYMFRALLRPSSGASLFCTYSLQSRWLDAHHQEPPNSAYTASSQGDWRPIIRSLLILHIKPPVTVCCWVGCFFLLWTVVTDQSWKKQPTQQHKVTGGCMCRVRGLLMMGARVPETCKAE